MRISFSSVSFYNNKFKFSLSYSITIIQMQYDMEDRRRYSACGRGCDSETDRGKLSEACAYYEAAIIKADSTLTDTQLAYDQGILEAKYTWESAEADAENAEYIRTYQTNEVENALTDHEEALIDIGDRITELEEGIADGSYDTSSSASSGGNETITEIWMLNE